MTATRSPQATAQQGAAHPRRPWLGGVSSRLDLDLLVIGSVMLLGILLALVTGGPLRAACGLALALLLPGYALTAAAFPRRNDLEPLERLALSFGLSVATAVLVGLGLSYSPWGAKLLPILLSLALFIVAASVTAYYRRRRLPPQERDHLSRHLLRSQLRSYWAKRRGVSALSALLGMVCAVSVVAIVLNSMLSPSDRGGFTEFYVLSSTGKAGRYPQEAVVGHDVRVTLALVNNEHEVVAYRVEITVDAQKVGQIGAIALAPGRKWEHRVSVQPTNPGHRQRIDFLLFKGRADKPDRFLRLWIEATIVLHNAPRTAVVGRTERVWALLSGQPHTRLIYVLHYPDGHAERIPVRTDSHAYSSHTFRVRPYAARRFRETATLSIEDPGGRVLAFTRFAIQSPGLHAHPTTTPTAMPTRAGEARQHQRLSRSKMPRG
jgi:uncharacterized membrane protein